MRLIKAYQTKNPCYQAAQKMPKGKPEGIIVHSTGANNLNLKRYVDAPEEVGTNANGNHWNRNVKKMAHAFIGYDKSQSVTVVNTLPYEYCCWGCGKGSKGSYNYDPAYLQFELCEDNLTNFVYFNNVYKTAIEYCAYLCAEYDIPVANIVSHKEAYQQGYASNHGDIDHWLKVFSLTMDDFRAEVQKLLDSQAEKEEAEETPREEEPEAEESKDYINSTEDAKNFLIKLLNVIINFIVDLFSEKGK